MKGSKIGFIIFLVFVIVLGVISIYLDVHKKDEVSKYEKVVEGEILS